MSLNNADAPAEVTVIERCAGRWLRFEELHFTEPNSGQQRSWEYVRRTHNRPDRVDAVEVVSVLRRQGYPDRIVLVTQYRPPIQRYCVEFPAGLVDPEDGTLLDAARREMLEETGYLIDVPEDNESAASAVKLSPTLFYEPGLSNSSVQMVFADINGDLPANQQPNQRLESDEWSLKTLLLPVQGLYESLESMRNYY
jgi:8-oxo-dGTP pyrophosphatase MutT (NUDIX family)